MPLTPERMDRVLDAHFRFEAIDDVARVLGTPAESVTHDVVGWSLGASQGREAARGFYEQTFADLADGRVRNQSRRYGTNFVVDESVWSGRAVGRPFGIPGSGRRLSFRMLHVIDFTEEGQIARENVWLDFAAIRAQLSPDGRA